MLWKGLVRRVWNDLYGLWGKEVVVVAGRPEIAAPHQAGALFFAAELQEYGDGTRWVRVVSGRRDATLGTLGSGTTRHPLFQQKPFAHLHAVVKSCTFPYLLKS